LWPRPLTAKVAAFHNTGFAIEELIEPMPVPKCKERFPEAYVKLTTAPRFLFFRLRAGAPRFGGPHMSQIDTNKSVVRRLLEVFLSCGDPALADQVLAPEFTDHNPSNPGLSGRDNLKRSVSDWCVAFPDTHTIVDDLIAEVDVAARWTSTATHRGAFLGIPATGIRVTVTGTGLFRLVDGRIVESRDHFDALGLVLQLGGTVAPGSIRDN
jgi:steroid delta-isomerase-like uncharacterized protein